MASSIESELCRGLRTVLADVPEGASIPDSEPFRNVLTRLEVFLPAVLREIHPEWKHESLDGILPTVALKTGEREAKLSGECILITDQTTTPFVLQLQTALAGDEIQWLELKLGERKDGRLVRTPYGAGKSRVKSLSVLTQGDLDAIDWFYKVAFGERCT